jgi:hypothetical protein
MATLFVDFENGNDNYAGSSFDLLASGTDGRITSTTFSSATASFPNDGSLIGQHLSIFTGSSYVVYSITAWVSSTSLTIAALSGGTPLNNQTVDRQYYIGGRWKSTTSGATSARTVPGDTIRVMGSPAPTSLGQTGVWTSQALQATKTITGASNATPISITCTAHGYSTGDTVVVTGVSGNTNANGTWEITNTGANTFTLDGSAGNAAYTSGGTVRLRNNTRVMLTSPVTQNIASTGPSRSSWVASTNVTTSLTTSTFKEHSNADTITIATAFTTGKAAYYTLPATLDLSGYQQVSFWINVGLALPANRLELRLCSDTTGDTVVNTISIPAVPSNSRWQVVTVDTGAALGSSIASLSLFVNTDPSTTTGVSYVFSNIIACKASSAADSLTLTSLIGKNTTGETFWGIQSINGTRVMLDASTNNTPIETAVRGYYGTSETVTTWKRETIKLGPAASSSTPLHSISESGTDGSPITYSGGWDRTAMSTQNLETWLDGVNGNGTALTASHSWLTLNKIAGVRFGALFFSNQTQGVGLDLSLIAANNNTGNALIIGTAGKITTGALCANIQSPLSQNTAGNQIANLGNVYSNNTGITNFRASPFSSIQLNGFNNGNFALDVPGAATGGKIVNSTFGDNQIGSVRNTNSQGTVYLYNCLFEESEEFQVATNGTECYFYSHNHDQTANNHKIVSHGVVISSAIDQRKTAGGISWKIQPTSTQSWNSSRPIIFSLAKVACAANSLVTVKAWMRRTDSNLTMRLVCKGGQIAGVSSDVVSAMTAAADTWEELTITFTPTEVGVVEITAEAWGGTTFSGWVDDMTISQA